MHDLAAQILPAVRLLADQGQEGSGEPWDICNLQGQLIELSEEFPLGALTFSGELILAAQRAGEPVVWISARPSIFFPPDFAENGIDVSSLAVVSTAGEREALWACDLLVRSGAFGLVVVDMEKGGRLTDAAMARLIHLARRRETAVLFLTVKRGGFASLSSMVTLRGVVHRRGSSPGANPRLSAPPLCCEITTVKDKRHAPGAKLTRSYDGPPGVC